MSGCGDHNRSPNRWYGSAPALAPVAAGGPAGLALGPALAAAAVARLRRRPRLRRGRVGDGHAERLLELPGLRDVAGAVRDERDDETLGAGAAGPAGSVRVVLGIGRRVEVDDAGDVVDVDA